MAAGLIQALWRYPVKSMQGEPLEQTWITPDGVPGDRGVAVVDAATGHVLSGKRLETLLTARAVARPGGPVIVLPDGRAAHLDTAAPLVSEWLGREVTLARADGSDARPVVEGEDGTFLGGPGTFFDSSPVHLVTTATLRHLAGLHPEGEYDARRFRPNVVVDTEADGLIEQDWLGRTLRLGEAVLQVTKPCTRCVMTTSEQRELPKDQGILRTVARETENACGIYARVLEPGIARVGDQVVLS
jgi:hypothetical protein